MKNVSLPAWHIFFEHLMFGGSVNVPDYDAVLTRAGGSDNAWTSNDFTNFYATVPAQNAETAFYLESDRMLDSLLPTAPFEVQRGGRCRRVQADTSRPSVRRCHAHYPAYGILSAASVFVVYYWSCSGAYREGDDGRCALVVLRTLCPNNAILSVTGNISF